jgi:hypothetical protein
MTSLFAVTIQMAACFGLGAAGLRILNIANESPVHERLIYAFALGMGLLGWLIFFIGVSGALNKTVLLALVATASTGMVFLRPIVSRRWCLPRDPVAILLITLLSLAAFLDILEALTPSGDADSLAYHFALPKQFLAAGQIEFVPRALDGAISLLVQMTYIPVLGLGGERAMMLWVLISGWMAVYAIYVMARRHLNENWSLALALIFATTPAVVYGAGSGQVEVRNLIFVVAAMLAVTDRNNSNRVSYVLLAGLLAGFFAGGKYLGLLFAATCGLAVLWEQRRLTPGIIYGVGVLAAGAQWYVWNAINIGDPVFPMLFEWLGKTDTPFWSIEHQVQFRNSFLPSYKSVPTNIFWLFAYPFKATLDGQLAFESGRTGFGPFIWIILAFIFGGLYRFRSLVRRGPLLTYILVVAVFFVLWFFSDSPQKIRFLLPVYPLLLVPVAVAAVRFSKHRSIRRPLIVAFAFSILIQIGGHTLFTLKSAKYVFGSETRDEFLERTISGYESVLWINKYLNDNDTLFSRFRHFLYYLDVPYFFAHPNLQAQVNMLNNTTGIKTFIHQLQKLEINYLLLPKPDDDANSGISKFAIDAQAAGCFELKKSILVTSVSSRTLPSMNKFGTWVNIYYMNPVNCRFL